MKKFLLLILLVPHYLFAEDLGYWNWTQFSTKIDDARLSLFVDNRFQDRTDEHNFRFASLMLAYPVHKNLDIGFNYSSYDSKPVNSEWKYGRRYEFELNPHYTFDNNWKLSLRNRLEFRRIEDQGSDNTRSRHRFRIDIPVSSSFKAFNGFFASNEFYINHDESTRWEENEFLPFGLNFQLTEQVTFAVFYLEQHKRLKGSSSWKSNPNIGTYLVVNF